MIDALPTLALGSVYKSYQGVCLYDSHGNLVADTGHTNAPAVAKERIDKLLLSLRGKWSFAIVKTMKQEKPGTAEVWENALLFPDGKSRPLRVNEIGNEKNKPPAQGVWLGSAAMKKVYPDVRIAPAVRFPYLDGAENCKLERWDNMVAFEKWAATLTRPLFVIDASGEPPQDPGLYAYCIHVAR